jgi:hypothetical protein
MPGPGAAQAAVDSCGVVINERPDLEILSMLHVSQRWFVRLATASHAAASLAMALRLAQDQRGNQLKGIDSLDGRYRLGLRQIRRLHERLFPVGNS